jgi:hypothetical protein
LAARFAGVPAGLDRYAVFVSGNAAEDTALGLINGMLAVDLAGKGIVVTAPVPGPGLPFLALQAVLLAVALARRRR